MLAVDQETVAVLAVTAEAVTAVGAVAPVATTMVIEKVEPAPEALEGATMYVTPAVVAVALVGVPDIAPVAVLNDSPQHKAAEIENAVGEFVHSVGVFDTDDVRAYAAVPAEPGEYTHDVTVRVTVIETENAVPAPRRFVGVTW